MVGLLDMLGAVVSVGELLGRIEGEADGDAVGLVKVEGDPVGLTNKVGDDEGKSVGWEDSVGNKVGSDVVG